MRTFLKKAALSVFLGLALTASVSAGISKPVYAGNLLSSLTGSTSSSGSSSNPLGSITNTVNGAYNAAQNAVGSVVGSITGAAGSTTVDPLAAMMLQGVLASMGVTTTTPTGAGGSITMGPGGVRLRQRNGPTIGIGGGTVQVGGTTIDTESGAFRAAFPGAQVSRGADGSVTIRSTIGRFRIDANGNISTAGSAFGISWRYGTVCATFGTIGGVLCEVGESLQYLPGLLTGFAYLTGLLFGVMGIAKLYEHVQNPHQTPIWESLKRFLAGGGMFALPIVIEAAAVTMEGRNGIWWLGESGWSGFVSGGGLDAMMARLMSDVYGPAVALVGSFAYLAGLVLIIIGINRMVKSSQEGPRGPSGFGTIMTFLTAGALLSLDSMMSAWTDSMFGNNIMQTYATMQYTAGMSAQAVEHTTAVISSVLAFVAILGWISFVRGWFIIRSVAEGDHQASLMSGVTHLFGGALAVNLGSVMNAVQDSLGLTAFGVSFT